LPSIDVDGKEAFILEEHRDALTKAVVHDHPPRFLPFEDNYIVAHGGPKLVLPKQHHRIQVPAFGRNKKTPMGSAAHIWMRTIVERAENRRLLGVGRLRNHPRRARQEDDRGAQAGMGCRGGEHRRSACASSDTREA